MSFPNLDFLLGFRRDAPSVMIVSPHPDDEVIGAGARLQFLHPTVVQVTDGSPPDTGDAIQAGYPTREAYAAARMRELSRAMSLAGVEDCRELGLPDQQSSFFLPELIGELEALISTEAPDVVITTPYEGGHPDHDSTAFAVAQACEHLPEWRRPLVVEMLSYHNRDGNCEMCDFLPGDSSAFLSIKLTGREKELKQALFDCFETQQRVLKWFPIGMEKFRVAPRYNFSLPPHSGQLYYEMFPWGMTGSRWRELSSETLRTLCRNRLVPNAA